MTPSRGIIDALIRFCLANKLVAALVVAALIIGGWRVMPFHSESDWVPRDPVPVDAIPDLGENQQVVYAEWPGRSPRDVENQVTYPLASALQGTPGVRAIRSASMFGFSIVYVIFDDDHEFYWCRSRLLERLSSMQRVLPEGVTPALGPDATSLGQIFWYTVESDRGGFDLMQLRTVQDWYVRYALQSVPGVSEVAGVGGFVREYQIDVDPDAMRAHRVKLAEVLEAVRRSNIDVGAESLEFSGAEYLVRGKGFIRSEKDLESVVIRAEGGVPLFLRSVATVTIGPALRRGMLDKGGEPAVGGVVLARFGENPLHVIERVKARIAEIEPGLPAKTLADGTRSRVRVVPFYDRSTLIHETLATLKDALVEQVLVTTFVVLLFLRHLRSSVVIGLTLPLAVLACFILMKLAGVDSNLMSLGGIAIAIGTLVDMGIILTENIVRHIEESPPDRSLQEIILEATSEIGPAVTTAILMTIIAFLPVFALEGPEGRLFKPLAYTKTFALLGSLLVAILIVPTLAQLVFARAPRRAGLSAWLVPALLTAVALVLLLIGWMWAALAAAGYAVVRVVESRASPRVLRWSASVAGLLVMAAVLVALTQHWMPLGPDKGLMRNLLAVLGMNLAWASVRVLFVDFYPYFLRLFLDHKLAFYTVPTAIIVFGAVAWLGFIRVFNFLPSPVVQSSSFASDSTATAPSDEAQPPSAVSSESVAQSPPAVSSLSTTYRSAYVAASHAFPGLGREFMPPLDEGSFLFMPSLSPHVGISAALEALSAQDRAIRAIPEVESVVGKIGRAESALDPAPIGMVETVVNYRPEFKRDLLTGDLVLDADGRPIRQWRDHIRSAGDIWKEIQHAAEYPGMSGAPYLQPIAARIVMVQSGMRASMGLKVFGRSLDELDRAVLALAEVLRRAPGVEPATVVPDRVVAKPYLEIEIDRQRIARHGLNIQDVQDVIETAVGGARATTVLDGRERYPVRVRYQRERRDSPEAIERISVPAPAGEQIPLMQLADIRYAPGPEMIKSEDGFLVAYVTFDKLPGGAEVEVVESAAALLKNEIAAGRLPLPPGTHYKFAGAYENQVRFQQRLRIILPLSLLMLLGLLYYEFRSVAVSLIVFSGIPVACAGGFIGLWLIAQPWFLDVNLLGVNLRELFHFKAYNLSAAVWVGFIALFSVTTDDGVVLATYLGNEFKKRGITGIGDIRAAVLSAGVRRVRPCLMTSATTVLSLLPVLTSNGRGADMMIPIALPTIGGLSIELLSLFVLPVTYSLYKEWQWRWSRPRPHPAT